MAHDVALFHRWDEAIEEMKIGATDRCTRHFDDRVMGIEELRIVDRLRFYLVFYPSNTLLSLLPPFGSVR